MLAIYIVFTCINWASAAIYINAPCPDIKVVEDFNMTKFCQGKLYQVGRYTNDIEKQGDCVTITLNTENEVCKFNINEISNGNSNSFEGYLSFPRSETYGVFDLISNTLKDKEESPAMRIDILRIDYDDFVFSYECYYNEVKQTRHDYAWVWSTSNKLSSRGKATLDEFLKSHDYIDFDKITWNHFTEEYCKLN